MTVALICCLGPWMLLLHTTVLNSASLTTSAGMGGPEVVGATAGWFGGSFGSLCSQRPEPRAQWGSRARHSGALEIVTSQGQGTAPCSASVISVMGMRSLYNAHGQFSTWPI